VNVGGTTMKLYVFVGTFNLTNIIEYFLLDLFEV